jgi:hypothetical protein
MVKITKKILIESGNDAIKKQREILGVAKIITDIEKRLGELTTYEFSSDLSESEYYDIKDVVWVLEQLKKQYGK